MFHVLLLGFLGGFILLISILLLTFFDTKVGQTYFIFAGILIGICLALSIIFSILLYM